MQKNGLVRTVYLYLFALVGLALLIVGGVMLIDLGLKMTVFQKADVDRFSRPSLIAVAPGKSIGEEDLVSTLEKCNENCDFTEEDKELIQNWLTDYAQWKQQDEEVSYTTQQRQRYASKAIALILIGLPLYLYHWTVIKKEIRKAKS